tara:strand:+ start:27 stop:248 length:222 start_codon:yes stop_codon:yes gene_type:complete
LYYGSISGRDIIVLPEGAMPGWFMEHWRIGIAFNMLWFTVSKISHLISEIWNLNPGTFVETSKTLAEQIYSLS